MEIVRNFPVADPATLASQVQAASGQVVSKTLVQNDALSLTLFAFAAGEGLAPHSSRGDALLTVLEGAARVTVADQPHDVTAGETILMPANVLHSVQAESDFKMALLQVFPN